jgi:hypothetical protein
LLPTVAVPGQSSGEENIQEVAIVLPQPADAIVHDPSGEDEGLGYLGGESVNHYARRKPG